MTSKEVANLSWRYKLKSIALPDDYEVGLWYLFISDLLKEASARAQALEEAVQVLERERSDLSNG